MKRFAVLSGIIAAGLAVMSVQPMLSERTPNGNDYGKDLLRQHYLTHPH